MIAQDFHWAGDLPDIHAIGALEAERLKVLPRWFKILCYAVDRAGIANGQLITWLAERNYYWQGKVILRMTRPLLFEDEYRFISVLDRFDEVTRRALRAFVTNYAERQSYQSKESMARTLLKKFGIDTTVLDAETSELVDLFEKLKPGERAALLTALRNRQSR